MMSYKRADVILVDIAFSGAVGYKRRPAVVISTEAFNKASIKLIVAAITSNLAPPMCPGDRLLPDWKESGLLKPSAMRGVLATVDQSDVVRKLGVLSRQDLTVTEEGIAEVLGFSVV